MTTTETSAAPAITVTGPPQWSPEMDPRVDPGNEATLLTIDRDGHVTAFTGKVEYGQGIRSGFTHEVADELDVPIDVVEIVMGDTRRVPYDRGTTGSASTRTVGIQLRRAAATAHRTLMQIAAERWGVDQSSLRTENGSVVDGSNSATYAELLAESDLALTIPEDIEVKDEAGFNLIGKSATRVDAVARVTGAAKYGQDIVLPGMLYGKILRPPSYGAHLQQIDTARAERVPGFASIVREGDFLGVLAEREDAAEYAIEAIRARWDEERDDASDWSLPAHLKERAIEPATLRDDGSLDAAFDAADHVVEGVYFAPYVANATMEPSAAVASWDGTRLTMWCGNRSPFQVRSQLAEALELSEDQVDVISTEIGGSFGSKSNTVALEAARLSRAVGRPVRVAYTRTEEFTWSTVRPAATIEIRSGVNSDGDIIAWDYTAYHAGETPFRGRRGSDTPYDVPNVRITVANSESPLEAGSYRSLGGAINHFAREVHMDELAAKLNLDPLEFRLRNLTHPRFRRVLESAAAKFDWTSRRDSTSGGVGLALGSDVGSYVAQCFELDVQGREVAVQHVTAAFDCGLVINPDGVRNQVEGSIMMGIGTALWESMEFDGGRVLNPGFSRYRVPRITDAPKIEVELVGDPSEPSSGAGEPAIVPVAAAVANAVSHATGKRIEQLPIIPQL